MRPELPRCRAYNFRIAVVFEDESFDVADREGDFGDSLAGRRGYQDGGVRWWVDVESLVATAAGVGWWWQKGGVGCWCCCEGELCF